MKKVISILLIFALVFSFGAVFANDEISVTIDGVKQNYDVMPVIINGRTLVPMRAIFEALGAEVVWDETSRTVTGKKDKTEVSLTIDSDKALLNGTQITLDAPSTIVNGRTLVPVRFISEALGRKVNWDQTTKTVLISEYTIGKSEDADALYKELNLTNIILDEKEYCKEGYVVMSIKPCSVWRHDRPYNEFKVDKDYSVPYATRSDTE